jgi:hypothetical protein
MADTLSDLLTECRSGIDAGYAAKYLHDIPDAPVADREEYIVAKCRGKRVLSLGASGPMDAKLKAAAAEYHAVDVTGGDGVTRIDLDKTPEELGQFGTKVDIVIAGEIIEHLSNPGRLLDVIRAMQLPLIVTAPNAFSSTGDGWLARKHENVNAEHVAWYSYRTLRTLLERHGFKIVDWAWYKGKPIRAEGLIFSVE